MKKRSPPVIALVGQTRSQIVQAVHLSVMKCAFHCHVLHGRLFGEEQDLELAVGVEALAHADERRAR